MAAKTRTQRRLRREVDEIWQYRTGGNLTTFDEDHGAAEEGRSRRSCSQAIRLRYNYTISSIPVVSAATFARPYFPLTAKIPKLPLQKGRAHVAVLTTGIDEMV